MRKNKHDSVTPVSAQYLQVTPRGNESQDKMIKRFMKKVRNDGILQEVYQRTFFEKPSVKRRRKKLNAVYNKNIEKDIEK